MKNEKFKAVLHSKKMKDAKFYSSSCASGVEVYWIKQPIFLWTKLWVNSSSCPFHFINISWTKMNLVAIKIFMVHSAWKL